MLDGVLLPETLRLTCLSTCWQEALCKLPRVCASVGKGLLVDGDEA